MSAVGSRILIIQDGRISVTAGTSASTPIVAALWSLLNDARLNAGKKQLGNLNHLIYTMAKDHPAAFNAVTEGNNKCTIGAQCCQYGYGNTQGYDAVNGFGTPNYEEIRKYVMALP